MFYGIELMFVESVMQIVFLFMQQTALLRLNTAWLGFRKCYILFHTNSRLYNMQYLAEKHFTIVYTQPRKMVM